MPAVEVSHVMEDCFVAAQRGELVLEPNGIDVLLQSVDLLAQISNESKSETANWDSFQDITASTVAQLRCVLQGRPVVSHVVETKPPEPIAKPETKTVTPNPVIPVIQPAAKPTPFPPETKKPSNHLLVPTVLLAKNAEGLRHELLAAFAHEPPYSEVVLDLSKTEDLDAIGLALLHSAVMYAEKGNRELKLQHASPTVRRVLSAMGIASLASRNEDQDG